MAKRRSNLGGRLTGDPELLAAALVGYEQQRLEIVERIGKIQRQLGGRAATATSNEAVPARKRTMSASARKRIAEAQRKRWAAYRNEQEPTSARKTVPVQSTTRPIRRMSAAARKRIADAQRKRWAAARKAAA